MFDLVYNIDYEVMALFVVILLYIETAIFYPKNTRKNKIFRTMALTLIIAELSDIASAFTITYGYILPNHINIIINSLYFMSGLLLCFMFHYYIQYAVIPIEGRQILIKTNKIILIAVEVSIIINCFCGFYFYFNDNGDYIYGPLFLLMHIMSIWFVICASATMIINRAFIKKSQFISSIIFILFYIVAVILQTFFFSDVLIIMPAVSSMMIIATFSLESPDYIQLQKTLSELTQTKLELEAANEKYYKLAYNDLMTNLKNRTAYNIQLEQLTMASFREQVIFLMADINNLKRLNDKYGHAVGDDAIIRTAKLLKKHFTDGCQCYRIGGDEFAVIAFDITEEDFIVRFDGFIGDIAVEDALTDYPFAIAAGYQRVAQNSLSETIKLADIEMYKNKLEIKKSER